MTAMRVDPGQSDRRGLNGVNVVEWCVQMRQAHVPCRRGACDQHDYGNRFSVGPVLVWLSGDRFLNCACFIDTGRCF